MRLEARAVAVVLADGGVAADRAVGGGNVGPVLMPSRYVGSECLRWRLQ